MIEYSWRSSSFELRRIRKCFTIGAVFDLGRMEEFDSWRHRRRAFFTPPAYVELLTSMMYFAEENKIWCCQSMECVEEDEFFSCLLSSSQEISWAETFFSCSLGNFLWNALLAVCFHNTYVSSFIYFSFICSLCNKHLIGTYHEPGIVLS